MSGAIAARGRLPSDDTPRPVIIRAVNCTGVETTLYGCSLTFASAQSCPNDQGVACQGQNISNVLCDKVYAYECVYGVCVCVCMHACMYIHMYVNKFVCAKNNCGVLEHQNLQGISD